MNKRFSWLMGLGLGVVVLASCVPPAPEPAATPRVTSAPTEARTSPPAATKLPPSKPATAQTATPAPAVAAAPYYEGKTIEVIVASGPGGGTDVIARAVATFLPRFIPGRPRTVVRNVPGAGGVIATNTFFLKARPDGLTLYQGSSSTFSFQQRGRDIVQYDVLKMKAIGNVGATGGLIAISKAALGRLTDPKARAVVMGVREGVETANLIPLYGREFLGWNVRWLPGFGGTGEIVLAFRRSEIDMFLDQGPHTKATVEEGLAEALAQLGEYRDGKFVRRTDFPQVPTFEEILGDKKPVGAPWEGFLAAALPQAVYKVTMAPPGTPDSTVRILREAYARMAADREFLNFLDKSFGEDYAISVGEKTERMIKEALEASPSVAYVDGLLRKFGVTK